MCEYKTLLLSLKTNNNLSLSRAVLARTRVSDICHLKLWQGANDKPYLRWCATCFIVRLSQFDSRGRSEGLSVTGRNDIRGSPFSTPISSPRVFPSKRADRNHQIFALPFRRKYHGMTLTTALRVLLLLREKGLNKYFKSTNLITNV